MIGGTRNVCCCDHSCAVSKGKLACCWMVEICDCIKLTELAVDEIVDSRELKLITFVLIPPTMVVNWFVKVPISFVLLNTPSFNVLMDESILVKCV